MARGDSLDDIVVLLGLGIVGALAYNEWYRDKPLDEIVKDIDSKLRGFLDDIASKLPALPPVPTMQFPQIQPAAAAPPVPDSPINPTGSTPEPTNTIDPDTGAHEKKPPVIPKGSGQLSTNPKISAPPAGSGGAIVAFAGDFDRNGRTTATMQSIDKKQLFIYCGCRGL